MGCVSVARDLVVHQPANVANQLRRQLVPQPPDDTHWPAPLMADVVDRPKKRVRNRKTIATTVFPNEQQDRIKTLCVINVALAGWAAVRSCALRLPMKECLANRIVIIHRRWRILFYCLVQGHKEQIGW